LATWKHPSGHTVGSVSYAPCIGLSLSPIRYNSPPLRMTVSTCSTVCASLPFPLMFLFISSNYQTWCDVRPIHDLFTSPPPSACRHYKPPVFLNTSAAPCVVLRKVGIVPTRKLYPSISRFTQTNLYKCLLYAQ
jgi:hypothetical protein